MSRSSLTPEEILSLLAHTPPRLAALTADLPPACLQTAADESGWSANEVLAHLRACADVWGDCITAIIAAPERPTLRAINPRSWMKKTDYREQDFPSSLRAFTVQRADLLAVLTPLGPEDWTLAATVTGAGRVLERTVFLYAQWLAIHERPHVKQIERIVRVMAEAGRAQSPPRAVRKGRIEESGSA